MFFVIRPPHPLMHHEHSGTLSLHRVVPDQHTFERGVALLVFNKLCLNDSLRSHDATT